MGTDGLAPGTRRDRTPSHRLPALPARLPAADRRQRRYGLDWPAYYLTCNGWVRLSRGYVSPENARRATVEPWPGNTEHPETITLVGPTATHWAASRGRLMWADATHPHPYYDCVATASAQRIRSAWTQERRGIPRQQPKMLRQGTRLGLDSEAPYGHYFEVLRAAVSTFGAVVQFLTEESVRVSDYQCD